LRDPSAPYAGPAADDTLEPIDLDHLREFCEGNADQMNKYINMFKASVPVFVHQLREGMDNASPDSLALALHNFKTRWIMLGMPASHALAAQIEAQCRAGESVDAVRNGILRLLAQAEEAVKILANGSSDR
jgi:HPt (histidine-containing phosphotransfer) domain-containing protein